MRAPLAAPSSESSSPRSPFFKRHRMAASGDREHRDQRRLPVSIFNRDAGPLEKRPPAGIIYKRITSDFFVVSSLRNDRIWSRRCNRGNGTEDSVLINYPAAETRQWDSVVTRTGQALSN